MFSSANHSSPHTNQNQSKHSLNWTLGFHGKSTDYDRNMETKQDGTKTGKSTGRDKNMTWLWDKTNLTRCTMMDELQTNTNKWIHKGQEPKLKKYHTKIILKFLIQGLHHPYTLPSKGEIVPPISIKLQNVPTVAIDDLPPTATHTVQYQTIADSKKCMCQSTHSVPHKISNPQGSTTQTIAKVCNCHRNKVAKDHHSENNTSTHNTGHVVEHV